MGPIELYAIERCPCQRCIDCIEFSIFGTSRTVCKTEKDEHFRLQLKRIYIYFSTEEVTPRCRTTRLHFFSLCIASYFSPQRSSKSTEGAEDGLGCGASLPPLLQVHMKSRWPPTQREFALYGHTEKLGTLNNPVRKKIRQVC